MQPLPGARVLTVDAHHHLWENPPAYAWLDDDRMRSVRRPFTVAQWQAQLRSAQVDYSVLVEGGRYDEAESDDLLRWAAEAPQIAGVVLWADLTGPGLAARITRHLRRFGGERVVVVRAQIQAEPDPNYLDRPDVRHGLRVVAAAGLAFDLVVRVDRCPPQPGLRQRCRASASFSTISASPEIWAGAEGFNRWRGPLGAGRTAQRHGQGVGSGDGGGLGLVARRRPATVRPRGDRPIRTGAPDVRFRLAGVPARG